MPTPGARRPSALEPLIERRGPLGIVIVAALLLLPGLGAIDLWAPDEPRYAQVAEELRAMPGGATDLVVLHLNGEAYTQKPPLYFWLAAGLGATRGRVDETAARLPSALAGIAVIACTAWLGGALLGSRRAGTLAAALLLTMPRFVHQARRAQLDVLLAACELVAIAAYWRIDARTEIDARPPARWLALLHGAIGLAVLTKGPVGALPWLVIVVHRALDRRPGAIRALFPLWGVALALGPALVWLAAVVGLAPSGWFDDAVLDNVLARFFSGTDHVRPLGYFLVHLPLDALPWTPLVVAGGVMAWRSRGDGTRPLQRAARLLLVWAAVFFVFFSISAGKRGLYMLPLLPGLAVLGAMPLARWLDAGRLPRSATASAGAGLLALGAAGAWLALGAPGATRLSALPAAFSWAAAAIPTVGAVALVVVTRRSGAAGATIAICLAALLALEVATLAWLYPALDPEKSPRPLARAAAVASSTQERVGVYRNGAFAGGLAYYSGRRVSVLESARDVREFVGAGNRLVVVRERDRATLAPRRRQRERAAARSGRRRLVLVELLPSDPTDGVSIGTGVDPDQPPDPASGR